MKSKYVWNTYSALNQEEFDPIKKYGRLLAKLLFVRGLKTEKEADNYLRSIGFVHSPFLMRNMKQAIFQIHETLSNKKRIAVYGDYDADGVTASAILLNMLREAGANVVSYIPDRFLEGYGLNKAAVKKLKEQNVDLVITVDCGIRSVEEVEYAKSLGLKIIITDHHEPAEILPDADFILSPKQEGDDYPDKNLAGCGIALKIAEAMNLEYPYLNINMDELIMIASIGTVADIVPLHDENRSLVKKGLELFSQTKSDYIAAMGDQAGFDPSTVTSGLISFTIAPRINAAGRMSHANTALKLLMSEDFEEASGYAKTIEELNTERQKITSEIQAMAEESVDKFGVPAVICVKDKNFNSGVVGLAASKLTEKYNRPSFVGFDNGQEVRISGRSIPEFNMISAMDAISDVFIKYGGHKMAAGATVPTAAWNEFVERINKEAVKHIDFSAIQPLLNADMILPPALVCTRLIDTISLLEPFGAENPEPLFEIRGLKVIEKKIIGSTKQHLKMKVTGDGLHPTDALYFYGAVFADQVPEYIDLICSIEKNTWHGNDSIQLNIRDIRDAKKQK
ncbi:MAG: single-stranded-DNA-specific exonuclease RecJ [Anaerolineaceae bacterium]|nr:single-stranded-DNA-specific exonuclease RecJ [Anaerolineaceae bacterium]